MEGRRNARFDAFRPDRVVVVLAVDAEHIAGRADNVVANFESQDVSPNIISAKGFGDTHPVAPNDTAEGRAQNCCTEIVLEGPAPDAEPTEGEGC